MTVGQDYTVGLSEQDSDKKHVQQNNIQKNKQKSS